MSENTKKAGLIETYPLLPVGIGFLGLALALIVAIFFVEAEASPQPITTALEIESSGAVEGTGAETAESPEAAIELMPVSADYRRLLNGLGALVMAVLGILCIRYTGLKGEEE